MKYRVILEGEYPVDAGKVYVEPSRDIDVPIPTEYLYYIRTSETPRCDLNWIPENLYQSSLVQYGVGGGFYVYSDYNLYTKKLKLKVCRYTEEYLEPYMTDVKLGMAILRQLTEEEQEIYPNKNELIRHVWTSDFDYLDIPKAGSGWQDAIIEVPTVSALYKKGDRYFWVLTMSHFSDEAQVRGANTYSGFYFGVLSADVSDETGIALVTRETSAGGRAWNTTTWNNPPAIILRGADNTVFYDNHNLVFAQPNLYDADKVTFTIPCATYQQYGLKSVTVYMARDDNATTGEVACALTSYEGFIRRWAVNRVQRADLPVLPQNATYSDFEPITFYFDPPLPPYWWQDDGLSHPYMNDGLQIGSISGTGNVYIAYYMYDYDLSLTMPRGTVGASWNFTSASVDPNDVAMEWERYCL